MSAGFDDEMAETSNAPPDWATEPLPPESTPKPNGAHRTPLNTPSAPNSDEPPERYHLDWPDLQNRTPPARRWAIEGWLGMGHATLLIGQGGIGKTLVAQQMLSCLSLGRTFIGPDPERELKCLMWACEDDHDELWRRQINVARWLKCGLDDFQGRFHLEPRQGLDNTILTSEFGKPIWTPLREQLMQQAHDYRADVVCIDNIGQTFGCNENVRHDVTMFINGLCGALPGRAILLLAHPSRSQGSEFSGSSAWENTVRTRIFLGAKLPGDTSTEDTDDAARVLAKRKTNYSAKDWRKLRFEDGLLIPEDIDSQGGLINSIRQSNAENTVLKGVAKLREMNKPTMAGNRSPNYIPTLLIAYGLHDGLSKSELAQALRTLELDKRLIPAHVGKGADRHPIIGLIPAET